MPARYSPAVRLLSMAAFSLAFFGWLNESWLFWFENPIWLNHYTEFAIIFAFGCWRIFAERDPYTRKRLIILVAMVTAFWWLIPWLHPVYEWHTGFLWSQPVFPSLHVPGTLTFFLILTLVFLFGRRVICGFNCPCVGIRETVGFPFREKTPRSNWTWRLRHSKWIFFAYYVGVAVATQFPPNSWTVTFVGSLYLVVAVTYFGSFYLAPLAGNRFYCRYLCPYGATFGLLNHAGFYGIDMDTDKCIDCQRCEQVCDMGIPVYTQGKQSGKVTALEDCMGCARCVLSCPTDALEIRDIRNRFNPSLKQDASHLLKKQAIAPLPRQEPPERPPGQRVHDWDEIRSSPSLAQIRAQASRCLDCGVPGCSNACPLANRIPEWLEAAAAGDIETAAEISLSTNNLPEVCGGLCPQYRLCEGSCTKAKTPGGAVTIGAIERYLNEEALRRGWRAPTGARRNTQRIAIVGAGPAGMACADQLNHAGCNVTVFDRQPVVGGLLATGVPPFKLDKSVVTRRHELLEQRGVCFELGIEVDEPRMQELVAAYDAVCLASGAQTPRALDLPGRDLPGVMDALGYLQEVNRDTGRAVMADRRVLVVGGGDTAIDCARSALREGAAEVHVAYRGDVEAMRASPGERQAACAEGMRLHLHHVPVEILGDAHVTGLRFDTPADTPAVIACDRVVLALGQVCAPPPWLGRLGVETDPDGRIRVDAQGRTSHRKIFAGGDNTTGPALVVTAIAAGRKAADGILDGFRPAQRALETAGAILKRPTTLPPPPVVTANRRQ